MIRQDHADDPQLVAFVVPRAPGSPLPHTLSSSLSQRLPAAKGPSRYTALAGLPLTPSGKIDRRALSRMLVEELAGEQRLIHS